MFERVVVGVTNGATAKEAAQRAQQLARLFGAELHVVTAFDERTSPAAADKAEQLLDTMAMASGSSMQMHTRPGDPVAAICDVASEVGADLVIVGNLGLAGSGKRATSVPSEVSRRAPCSVLILDTV
jgi:nucleotide-binding universal stress UspA family protein